MKFLPAFVLRVTHAYYTDNRCPDFLIEPNPETERLLSNHRCVLKPLPDGIRVLTAVDDGGKAFIALPPEATFTFHLRLHNPDFVLFTDLSGIEKQAAPIYTNERLSSADSKELTIKYPIEPRVTRGVFADVEIHNNYTLQPVSGAPVEFQIAFTPKQTRWQYYVVTNRKLNKEEKYRIIDNEQSPEVAPLVFSDKNRRNLNQDPDTSDGLAQELARQYPEMQRFRFVSDDLIPCRQAARKCLGLYLDGSLVCGTLPNPSFRNYAKIEVKDGAPPHQQDALFQVVKY